MTLEDKLKAFYKQVALQEETIANKGKEIDKLQILYSESVEIRDKYK